MALPHDHGENTEKLLHHMPPAEEFQHLAEVFQQLSDGTRLRIFWILSHGEVCVANLSAPLGMSSPAVSHHLRLLKNAGLITSRREGKEVYYRAKEATKTQLLHDALEALMAIQCPMEESAHEV